jgi:hypothetical protein
MRSNEILGRVGVEKSKLHIWKYLNFPPFVTNDICLCLFSAKDVLTYLLASRIEIVSYSIFNVKYCKKKRKKLKHFLFINFRLAVKMLQLLIYTLKTIDGSQHLPSPGFHLNVRYFCFETKNYLNQ